MTPDRLFFVGFPREYSAVLENRRVDLHGRLLERHFTPVALTLFAARGAGCTESSIRAGHALGDSCRLFSFCMSRHSGRMPYHSRNKHCLLLLFWRRHFYDHAARRHRLLPGPPTDPADSRSKPSISSAGGARLFLRHFWLFKSATH